MVAFASVGFTSCIWHIRASSRPVPNLAASGTSTVANDAFLAEPFGSASASLSSFTAALALTTAFAFAFASPAFSCTFQVRAEEASAELPLSQKLPYLAVVCTDGNRGVFIDDSVYGGVVSNVNTVWVGEFLFYLPVFEITVVEAFR
jgi:hypothetical protein